MGAIDNFLKRWGYAKLDRYGLVLTPDDRVISTRPSVLDDGLGGKIVGWTEDDLAAMELEKWRTPKGPPKKIVAPPSLHTLPPAPPAIPRAAAAPVAAPVVVAPVAALAPAQRPLPGVAPIAAPVIAPTPIAAPVAAPAPVVAADEEPGEDEWEWEIAMARARAVETDVTRADLAGAAAKASSWTVARKTNPGVAPVTKPLAANKSVPEPLPEWPGTEPFNESWADKSEVAPQVMSVLQKKLAVQRSTPAKGAAQVAGPRSTVIPVPSLPTTSDPRSVRPAVSSASARRVARGTETAQKLEDTVQTMLQPAPVVHDDRTSPYITLPNEVKPSGYAHTKRVASKQR